MAALTADLNYKTSGLTETVHGVLTASVTYYKGGIVQFDKSTGKVKKPADVANEFPYGVLKRGYVAPASPAMDCEIEHGKIWIPLAAAAQTHVGVMFYATDDQLVTVTPITNGGPIGMCVDVQVGVAVLIDFRTGGQKGIIG